MSALRQAAHDYIDMRRGLGFKFEQAGRGLIDFVSFLEASDAPYISPLNWPSSGPSVHPIRSPLTGPSD